ncbi:MAG: squalene/phytoene synthase family protein [Alphaproteobacteria bacterium]|nr:squalene/phytoene synthase family protein [Alphaproteobacteria bacterium]MCL2505354.1 squalene/phytoene synthase family protein [Alphaproteobacteria bacterium]
MDNGKLKELLLYKGSETGKNSSNENFPVGSLLIKASLRPHVHTFYRFARTADDISDHPLMEPQIKIELLNELEAALLGNSESDIPVAMDMRASLEKTNISAKHCTDLLRAFKQDAVKRRYASWEELIDYCNFSAAPVGRYVLALHNIHEEVWQYNDALCNALQIINHIQDCADDYRELDRVYIPEDMLNKNKASIIELSEEKSSDALKKTLHDMLDMMSPMMNLAGQFTEHIPSKRLKLEVAVIHSLAEKMIRTLYEKDPLTETTKLSKFTAGCSAVRGILKSIIR